MIGSNSEFPAREDRLPLPEEYPPLPDGAEFHPPAPAAEDPPPSGSDLRTVTPENAAEEIMRNGAARVETEAGTYELWAWERSTDGKTMARIVKDGKLLQAKAFDTAREAAEYAASYVSGNARGTVEAELYNERSEEIPQPEALDALFDPNGYTNEVTR